MAAGMKDVASLAGVAVGTVSNVLNHPDLVRPLTRARVEAAMEQLGFIPNGSARQLRAGRSRCLGLVVLDVTNPFFTEVARGVEDYAQAAGYAVILCNSDEADDKERRYLRVLEEQRVRGILITPVHGRAPELRRIRERGTPVVLLDRPGSAGQCSVAVDDRRGGEIAVSHLLGLGHRRIALVNGPVAIRQCADRRRGALRAVERAGLDPAAVLTEVTVPAMNARAGAAAADELLGRGRDRPRCSAPTTCSPWGCCGGWARPGWRCPGTSPWSATTTSSSPPTPRSRSPRCASPSTSSAGPPPSSCSTRPTGPTSTSTAASCSSPNWSRGPAAARPPARAAPSSG